MSDALDEVVHERQFSGSDVYVPAPGAAEMIGDHGAVVLHAESREVRLLDAVASIVWQYLGDDLDVDALADELATVFGTSADVVWRDVMPMLEALSFEGFLVDLAHPEPPRPLAAGDDATRYLDYPPCGCLTSVDDIGWAQTTPLRIGRDVFTVRTNDLAAHQVLAEALGVHVVDDPAARPYYSVELSADPGGRQRVWEGNTILFAEAGTAPLWERLSRLLARHLLPVPGLLRTEMLAAVGPRGAALVPPGAANVLTGARHTLAERGVLLVDGPTDLDLASGELVVGSGLEIEPAAAARFAGILPGPRPLVAGAPPGIVPLVAVPAALLAPDDALDRTFRTAQVLLEHAQNAREIGSEEILDGAARLAATSGHTPPPDLDGFPAWLLGTIG